MFLDQIRSELNAVAEAQMEGAHEVQDGAKLGLDPRAGYEFYVGEDFICVPARADKTLQYYGGFEYVEGECRLEVGDWVFYSDEDSRVADHLEQYWTAHSDETENDGQPDEAQEWHDFDPDC